MTKSKSNLPPELQNYIQSLLDALGSRDPFEVLRETPRILRETIGALDPAQLRRPEAEGKWSAVQVLQHLADSDLVSGFRFRMILAHDQPQLPAYDQDLWATRLHYDESDPQIALNEFSMLRRANLRLLERTTPEERKRYATHAERGDESIDDLLHLYAGHDVVHLRQIKRILTS